jgi:4-hydroxy-tetrahydrodipicolinate reductase
MTGANGRIPVAVAGATGRMGSRVVEAIETGSEFRLVARPGRGALDAEWNGARVLADLTSPEATATLALLAAARGVGLLVGTTGLDARAEAALHGAADHVPVMVAPNLSMGVAALKRALRSALASLPGWDVEIIERHHAAKVDSPSGTALALARAAAEARGLEWPEALKLGRSGRVGPRSRAEIGVHSVRGGGWIGEHQVLLAGPNETLELGHVALSRACFVEGALVALRFLASARPGYYALEDALNPRSG